MTAEPLAVGRCVRKGDRHGLIDALLDPERDLWSVHWSDGFGSGEIGSELELAPPPTDAEISAAVHEIAVAEAAHDSSLTEAVRTVAMLCARTGDRNSSHARAIETRFWRELQVALLPDVFSRKV